jgi:hypothetical protein
LPNPSAMQRSELRRDPTPSRELLASFDPLTFIRPIDEALAQTEDPRHRMMLLNYRTHAIYEMLGRWDEILNDVMFVEEPFYRFSAMPPVEGYEGVRQFYDRMLGHGPTCGLLSHNIAVADWGLAVEALMYMQISGSDLIADGHAVDPASWYAVTNWSTAIWPYDDEGRLIGEMIYDDPASRRVTELDPEFVMAPSRMREILTTMLDEVV